MKLVLGVMWLASLIYSYALGREDSESELSDLVAMRDNLGSTLEEAIRAGVKDAAG